MTTNKYLRLVLTVSLCILASGCHGKAPEQSSSYSIEAYFSPDGKIRDRIIKAIDSSSSSIDLAIFDFTSQDIKSAFERAKNKGVKVRIVADSRQAKGVHSVVQMLIDEGFDVKITHGKSRGIMHNKFAIFDKKLMVTGSYNWTENAEHFNYENAVFIIDPSVISLYQKEFDKIYNSASR
jgi:phosphatidylserine/phosphatidylglycerophosphate/cardiolipin synthase-like enzyme